MVPPHNAANRTNYDLIPFSNRKRKRNLKSLEPEPSTTSADLPTSSLEEGPPADVSPKEESLESLPSLSSALKEQLLSVDSDTQPKTLVPSRKARKVNKNDDQSVSQKSPTIVSIDTPKARVFTFIFVQTYV